MLKRPIISEKTMKLAGISTYTFEVEKNATKPGIAKLISEMFKVNVLGVRITNVKGKVKWQRKTRRTYTLANTKKAIITLKKGQIIPLFEAPKEMPEDQEVTVTRGEEEAMVTKKEKKSLFGRTKVKIESGATGAAPTTQRKVITGK